MEKSPSIEVPILLVKLQNDQLKGYEHNDITIVPTTLSLPKGGKDKCYFKTEIGEVE
jgi:hypothetical protein